MLGAAAIGAVITGGSPQLASAEARNPHFEAFATVSPFAAFLLPADGHGPDSKGAAELGIGGAAAYRLGRYFDLGLGLRYDYGRGSGDSLHALAAPLTATLVIPIGTERELRAGVGLGLGFGWVPGYGEGDSALRVFGASGELALGFAQRIRPSGLGLCLQAGTRFELLEETNAEPDSYLAGGELIHIQLPFIRVGATWR